MTVLLSDGMETSARRRNWGETGRLEKNHRL